ncbi:hypothetical protein E2C01_002262 [Portunus trituberculatus]|uniref:Uncharacterized protein n=1 Tax=Portunus trituberculatus TaxID=210409 RepID=A0A5B7CJ99_PORTR|nr:hypothetical protein [Portunus trituberculatus]
MGDASGIIASVASILTWGECQCSRSVHLVTHFSFQVPNSASHWHAHWSVSVKFGQRLVLDYVDPHPLVAFLPDVVLPVTLEQQASHLLLVGDEMNIAQLLFTCSQKGENLQLLELAYRTPDICNAVDVRQTNRLDFDTVLVKDAIWLSILPSHLEGWGVVIPMLLLYYKKGCRISSNLRERAAVALHQLLVLTKTGIISPDLAAHVVGHVVDQFPVNLDFKRLEVPAMSDDGPHAVQPQLSLQLSVHVERAIPELEKAAP